jgi:hypothetical protein
MTAEILIFPGAALTAPTPVCSECKLVAPRPGSEVCQYCDPLPRLPLKFEEDEMLDAGLDASSGPCPVCKCPMLQVLQSKKNPAYTEKHCPECGLDENYQGQVIGQSITGLELLKELVRLTTFIESRTSKLGPADWLNLNIKKSYEAIKLGKGIFANEE